MTRCVASLGRRFLLGGFLLTGLTGCKDKGVDKGDWPSTYAREICEQVVECMCEYENPTVLDHCLSDLTTRQLIATNNGDQNALSFDGVCADRFLDDLADLQCKEEIRNPDAKCKQPCKLWYGPMGRGATCVQLGNDDNCQQGLVCDNDVCVDPCDKTPPPKLGEPCFLGECEERAWCDTTDELNPICRDLPGVGKPCQDVDPSADEDYACAANAFCESGQDQPMCVALPKLNEPCLGIAVCGEGMVCTEDEVCVALPKLGEACIRGECVPALVCDMNGDSPVCVNPPPRACNYYGGTPDGLPNTDTSTSSDDTSTTP